MPAERLFFNDAIWLTSAGGNDPNNAGNNDQKDQKEKGRENNNLKNINFVHERINNTLASLLGQISLDITSLIIPLITLSLSVCVYIYVFLSHSLMSRYEKPAQYAVVNSIHATIRAGPEREILI